MSKWPQYDAERYYVGESDDYGSGLQPSNTAGQDDWPEIVDGFIPRKLSGQAGWEQVENHKGEEGYVNGEPFTIKDFGPYPDGWSTEPPPPSQDELKAQRRAAILARLEELDAESVRPLRAIVRGEATKDDTDKLAALDAEAAALRLELAALDK